MYTTEWNVLLLLLLAGGVGNKLYDKDVTHFSSFRRTTSLPSFYGFWIVIFILCAVPAMWKITHAIFQCNASFGEALYSLSLQQWYKHPRRKYHITVWFILSNLFIHKAPFPCKRVERPSQWSEIANQENGFAGSLWKILCICEMSNLVNEACGRFLLLICSQQFLPLFFIEQNCVHFFSYPKKRT